MTPSLTIQTAKSDLEAFLYAPIGEEGNGMTLSVLSGLSRLGVNPWDEAARLSLLPREGAITALDQRIVQLPRGAWQLSDTMGIAARLVALLPKHNPHPQPDRPDQQPDSKKPSRPLMLWLIAGGLAAFLLFGMSGRPERLLTGDGGVVAPVVTPAPRPLPQP